MKSEYQLRKEMMGAWANWAFCSGYNRKHPGHYTKELLASNVLVYRRARAALAAGQFVQETNERGNEVYRDEAAIKRLGVSANFFFDFYDYSRQLAHWTQLPTWQDASYFGVIYDRESRCIFTYAEGDKTLVVCATDESFKAELDSAIAFYKKAA